MNPWESVPLEDYEHHMKDSTVGQLQELSKVIELNLDILRPKTILFLGCAAGNGFEHIDAKVTSRVIGVDINREYLDVCHKRFGSKDFTLELICCDIDQVQLELEAIDYISCALFLEYVDWHKLTRQVRDWMDENSVFNIVIQRNNKHHFVSHTGIKSLNVLGAISHAIDEEELELFLSSIGMGLIEKSVIGLPNGKEFINYNYKRDNQLYEEKF